MKIAICTHKFSPPLLGGVDVYADRLRRAFLRLGHEVVVLAFDPTGAGDDDAIRVSREEQEGTPVWRLKFAFSRRPKRAFDLNYDPEMGAAARPILEGEKPDLVVIMNFYTITLALVEAAKSLGMRVAHVATDFVPVCRRGTFIRWHGRSCEVGESVKSCTACMIAGTAGRAVAIALNQLPQLLLTEVAAGHEKFTGLHPLRPFNPYWRHVAIMDERLQRIRPLRHQVDLVLAPTKFTRDVFTANGFRPEQVRLLTFGVDTDTLMARVQHQPADQVRFLFIGRMEPYKGAHLLLEAFNNLPPAAGATLTLYGGPARGYEDYFRHLESLIARNDRARFAGFIPPDELPQAFAAADYFLLPSTWHENCPLILLDALQSRTPVISSDIGGVTDIVHDGVNGLLFPMGDRPALQQVLERVVAQPELRQSFQPGARLGSIDEYAGKMIDYLQQLES